MFLIDNDAVRSGWQAAKTNVQELVSKYGGSVTTARRWDERRLAYPINRRRRATFLLSFCELPADSIPSIRRDLDISEVVMRHQILRVDEVPKEEFELAEAEGAADFAVPEPPDDDALEPEEIAALEAEAAAQAEREERAKRAAERAARVAAKEGDKAEGGEAKAEEGEAKAKAEGGEAKAKAEGGEAKEKGE